MAKTVQAILWMIYAFFCPTARSVKKICGRLTSKSQGRQPVQRVAGEHGGSKPALKNYEK